MENLDLYGMDRLLGKPDRERIIFEIRKGVCLKARESKVCGNVGRSELIRTMKKVCGTEAGVDKQKETQSLSNHDD